MKTLIVNLERSKDRKSYMDNLLSKYNHLDIEYISAVDGRLLNETERNSLFDIKKFKKYELRNVRPGEIGCTLSHQKCYAHIINKNLETCLILEDDIIITRSLSEILPRIEEILKEKEPTVVLLSGWYWHGGKRQLNADYQITDVTQAFLTHAYALNKEAAQLMLDDKPWYVADAWKMFRKRGIRIFGLKPHIIDQDWGGEVPTVVNDVKIELISPLYINKLRLHLRGLVLKIKKIRGFETAQLK